MTSRDLIGLGISYVYASGLLVLAEVIRRWRGYPQDFTRKLVHIGAGMWVFGILALFDNWYIGIVPFTTFIGLNYLFYRFRIFESMDATDSTPGTVYFAFAISLLFLLLWRTGAPPDYSPIAVAGVMAMTWGDSTAAIIGKRWGKHKYTIWGSTRSVEGSLVMFSSSLISTGLTLLLLPGSVLSPLAVVPGIGISLAAAIVGSLVAAVAEAVSPAGLDNISVPLLSAGAIFILIMAFS